MRIHESDEYHEVLCVCQIGQRDHELSGWKTYKGLSSPPNPVNAVFGLSSSFRNLIQSKLPVTTIAKILCLDELAPMGNPPLRPRLSTHYHRFWKLTRLPLFLACF